jgi:hypothetical protein
MPGLSGFDVVRELRSSPQTASLPIVICTAKELSADELRELRGQVESVVQKASGPSDLLQELLQLERFYPRLAGVLGGPSGHAVSGHFLPHLERELSRAQRHGRAFSLAAFWIPEPGGGQANGALGSLCGELTKLLRRYDLVAHDHEEILVLLPELDGNESAPVLAKMRQAMAAFGSSNGNAGSKEWAIGQGMASFPRDAKTASELIEGARRQARENVKLATGAGVYGV